MSESMVVMSNSDSRMEIADLPTLFLRDNGIIRANANPTGLTIEQIEGSYGTAFVDHLVKYKRERYNSPNDRHEVTCSDPIAIFVCERWIEEITAKPYKFCDPEEEEGFTEIMMDIKQRWTQLNMREIEMAIYPKWAGDGYCLTQLKPDYKTQLIAVDAFGFFESPPDYWKRINMRGTPMHNAIYEYYINYVPVPNGYEYMGNYNIHAEIEYKKPTDPGFFHFYRKEWNYGIGKPRLQGIWASLTKLRKISHADYKRKCIFNILEYPDAMDDSLVQPLVEAARRADEMEGMAIPKRINPQTGETEDFPRIFDRTWDQTGAAPGGDASAGGTLLRNPEYARVLTALGYTETKLVGSQPGAVTGSKLDLTRDDEVDIREFNLWKSVIKELLKFLLQIGALEGCDEESLQRIATDSYDIKCHTEYEVLENQAMAAEMADEQASMQGGQTMNSDYIFKYNSNVHTMLMNAIRYNFTMPMTPVLSAWIKAIGAEDGTVYMQTLKRSRRGIDTYAYPIEDEEGLYQDWIGSGSKGEFWWDRVRDILSPAYKYGAPPAYLETGYGGELDFAGDFENKINPPSETSFSKPGYSAKPFTTPPSGQGSFAAPQTPFNLTDTGGFETQPKEWGIMTPGYVHDPKSITGSKKVGPGKKRKPGKSKSRSPIIPYNPTAPTPYQNNALKLNSQALIRKLGENVGWGMSNSTAQNIMKLLHEFDSNYNWRYNSIQVGNPMDFEVLLKYSNPQDPYKPLEEKICKREWKKINAHTGSLYLYRDLGHGGDRHVVGNYDYWWDDREDKPKVKMNYEDDKIRSLLKEWNREDSIIMDRLNKNLPISMSTEYFCGIQKFNGVRYQVKFHDKNGDSRFNGIALVERGNCDEPFCNFEVEE